MHIACEELKMEEHKKAEEELKKSEIKYRSLVENAGAGVATTDWKGRFTFVNKTLCKMIGYSEEELIGKPFADFLHPDDKKKILKIFWKAFIRPRREVSLDFRVVHKKGHIIHMHSTPTITLYKNKVIGFNAIITDITESKKMEEALRESEEKFKNIFESANDCMIYLDKSGRILDVNKKAIEVFGGSKKEVLGKHFTSVGIFSLKEIPLLMTNFSKILAGKKVAINIRIKNKKGKEILLECSSSLMKIGDKFAGMLVIARDITECKRAEDALWNSDNKSRTLLENLPQKIFFKDRKLVYVSCNGNYARDLKIKSSEIAGRTDYDFFPKKLAEKYRTDDKRIMESGKTEDIEEEYIQDGQKVFVHTVKTPVKDENGNVVGILGIFWDISDRKKAEEELIRLSSAVKTSTDSIVISDTDGKILDVNEATLKMYGSNDKEDFIGKSSFSLIAPEEREKALAGAKYVLEKGYLKSLEYHILTKNGNRIPVEMSAAIMKDTDGKSIGFVDISRDITKRKRMEEALKRQRDIAITLSGARNLIEALNRLFDNLLEIREFDCVGFYLVDKDTGALDMIVHRGLPDGFVEKVSHLDADSPYTKVIMEGKPIYQKTSDFPPAIRKDLQSDGILAAAAIPIQYKGEIIGNLNMASHTHDEISTFTRQVLEYVSAQIGENIVRARMEDKLKHYSEHLEELVQKRTEELLESEKRYSVLVEEARDGVVILQDGKIVFTNKRGPELIDYSRGELIGLPFVKLVDEKYRQLTKERYEQRLQGERILPTYEIKLISKTGKHIPVELSATSIHYQGRPADLIIVRDIRERKRMEEQRLKLEKLAAIGEVATMVGHDLRNPLQSIENATYYLNNELPHVSIPQKATEMLQIINNSVNYADKIIKDLQDFSAPQKPLLKKTNINAIVEENLSRFETPKNVELITELHSIPEIKADKDMTKRVFLNLIMNGIQAMENGGTLKISTKKTRGFVEVSFKDTGIGMSKENMGKIFTPFFTTRAKGMGMGLAICKKFVDAHDGNITVESEEGKGTTFTVKLPIK